MSVRTYNQIAVVSLLVTSMLSGGSFVQAQQPESETRSQLKVKIESQNKKIDSIEKEIDEFESELQATKSRQRTLNETVSSLNDTIERLQNRSQRIKANIADAENKITDLEKQINQTKTNLQDSRTALANAVRAMRLAESQTLFVSMLSAESLSAAWEQSDRLAQIQAGLQSRIKKIEELQNQLNKQRKTAEKERQRLQSLKAELDSQQAIIADQRRQKQSLLEKTDQQAEKYQQLLAKKRQKKREFQNQLRSFESQLESTVTDAGVPQPGSVAFSYPVPNVEITQRFGGTAFAKRNPDAYGRAFHNGTDFGVSVGTPITPTDGGTVRAVGNTDRISGCFSYGKWVLVDHDNGLSTLYAHLSNINTNPGADVTVNTTIGYSGNTGYSTGPHLHLTTYIQDDVNIQQLGQVKDQTNCGGAEIPIAPQAGYLNPMKYLPNTT